MLGQSLKQTIAKMVNFTGSCSLLEPGVNSLMMALTWRHVDRWCMGLAAAVPEAIRRLPSLALSDGRRLEVRMWPRKSRAAVTVSFDDLSPMTSQRGTSECGGGDSSKLRLRVESLVEMGIRMTQFVPSAPVFDPGRLTITDDRFSVSDPINSSWLQWVKRLVSSGQVEIACHGVRHFNSRFGSPAEFDGLDAVEALALMRESVETLRSVGFAVEGFRPPAWGLGSKNASILAAKTLELLYVAASGVGIGLNSGSEVVSDVFPDDAAGILNIPQNIVVGMPMKQAIMTTERIVAMGGLISLKGHLCDSHFLVGSLNASNYRWLQSYFRGLHGIGSDLWLATHVEVARQVLGVQKVKLTEIAPCWVQLRNPYPWDLADLTLSVEKPGLHPAHITVTVGANDSLRISV